MLNLMRDLQDQFGLTYLLITHNLAVVKHMADDVGVLYLGRLGETAPARELFARPRHPYSRMLLEAIPDLSAFGRPRQAVTGEIPNPMSPPSGCTFHPRCPLVEARCRAEVPRALPQGQASSPAMWLRSARRCPSPSAEHEEDPPAESAASIVRQNANTRQVGGPAG